MPVIQETAFTTRHYEDKNGYVHVDVLLYKDRLYSITIRGSKTIELDTYDIKLILEVLKRHPLPEEGEER